MSDGSPTGFADQAFDEFESISPDTVLMNLAELDWRIRKSGAPAAELLGRIWRRVSDRFQCASSFDRHEMLRHLLARVAHFQPVRVLELVRYAINHPVGASEEERRINELLGSVEFAYDHVIRQIPYVLRGVARTLEFVRPVLGLLWELGRDDTRDLRSHAEHPIRVVQDIAGYDVGKSFAVNEIAVETARAVLEQPDSHAHAHSPLIFLDGVLARSGFSSLARRHGIEFAPFSVPLDSVRHLRRSALDLVFECAQSSDLRAVGRALETLEKAIEEPRGHFNQVITEEERAQWEPEQLEIMERIEQLVPASAHPLLQLGVRKMLVRHCARSSYPEVQRKACTIVASIVETPRHRLFRSLAGIRDFAWVKGTGKDYSQASEEYAERTRVSSESSVQEFLTTYPDAAVGFGVLAEMVEEIAAAGMKIAPAFFLESLASSRPGYAEQIARLLCAQPDSVLASYLPTLIAAVHRTSNETGARLAAEIVSTGSPRLHGLLAQALWFDGFVDDTKPSESAGIQARLNVNNGCPDSSNCFASSFEGVPTIIFDRDEPPNPWPFAVTMHEFGHYFVWTYGDLANSACSKGIDESSPLDETVADLVAELGGFYFWDGFLDYQATWSTLGFNSGFPANGTRHLNGVAIEAKYGNAVCPTTGIGAGAFGEFFEHAIWEILFDEDCTAHGALYCGGYTNGDHDIGWDSSTDARESVAKALGFALDFLPANTTYDDLGSWMVWYWYTIQNRQNLALHAASVMEHHGMCVTTGCSN